MSLKEFDEFVEELLHSGWYSTPKRYFGMEPATFSMLSFKRWALIELRDYVMSVPYKRPVDSVEVFRRQMDCFACQAKGDMEKNMFSTAYDVATDILDMLL